ncbi:hypothetical protein Q9233_016445 [Columba guinea]|nr:hypothetical protein Q9233_016445 [Columba guinea]
MASVLLDISSNRNAAAVERVRMISAKEMVGTRKNFDLLGVSPCIVYTVLHHELLLELTLLLAFFQASKLQCRWIMTAGELCCICKSPSYIKGTSEQTMHCSPPCSGELTRTS